MEVREVDFGSGIDTHNTEVRRVHPTLVVVVEERREEEGWEGVISCCCY